MLPVVTSGDERVNRLSLPQSSLPSPILPRVQFPQSSTCSILLHLLRFPPFHPLTPRLTPQGDPWPTHPTGGVPPRGASVSWHFQLAWFNYVRFINKTAHAQSNPIVCHVTPLPFASPPCPPSPPSSLPRPFPSLFVLRIPAIVCRVAQSLFNLDHSCLISSCTHPAGCCPLAGIKSVAQWLV